MRVYANCYEKRCLRTLPCHLVVLSCLVLLLMIDTDTRFFLCLDGLADYNTWLAILLIFTFFMLWI